MPGNTIDTSMATIFQTFWKSKVAEKQEMITFQKSSEQNIMTFNKGNAILIRRYDSAVESVRNPTYSSFLQDNLIRLLGGNGTSYIIKPFKD